jgi:SAM-dependent methyltransferase
LATNEPRLEAGRQRKTAFNYDAIAEAYAAGVDSAPYNALYERPAMLELLPNVDAARVLDAGCAGGWYAVELARRGALVTGVDSSATLLDHAKRRVESVKLSDRIDLHLADLAEPLDFIADHTLDGIVSSLVLHYIRDWGPTLREFHHVLKPGGWLLFSTHHPAADARRFEPERYLETELIDDYWEWVGTVRFFRRPLSSVIQSVADAGFVIEKLVEPLPTEEFRRQKPESYEHSQRWPEFLIIRAWSPAILRASAG